jgi:hypothetical protein
MLTEPVALRLFTVILFPVRLTSVSCAPSVAAAILLIVSVVLAEKSTIPVAAEKLLSVPVEVESSVTPDARNAPFTVAVAVIVAAPTVPVNVGSALSTFEPLPVLVLVPVPPLATGRIPLTSAVSDTAPNVGAPEALPWRTVVVVPREPSADGPLLPPPITN